MESCSEGIETRKLVKASGHVVRALSGVPLNRTGSTLLKWETCTCKLVILIAVYHLIFKFIRCLVLKMIKPWTHRVLLFIEETKLSHRTLGERFYLNFGQIKNNQMECYM